MGLVLLWKPRGPGSQDLLGEFKRELRGGTKRDRMGIGHTGTLDPFAEGLLLVGEGEATKLLAPLTGLPKRYEASMILGATSLSFDDDGEVEFHSLNPDQSAITPERLQAFLQSKLGAFEQIPPAFSAVHVDGKRSHEWARAGVAKELKPRRSELLEVKHLGLQDIEWKGHTVREWRFEVVVSSGTYIRAFARDWARELTGQEALLSKLVRTGIGPLSAAPGVCPRWLEPSDLGALFETIEIPPDEAKALQSFGRWTLRPGYALPTLIRTENEGVLAWCESGSGKIGRVFSEDPFRH